ncbi:heme ABC transporter permease [Candidatus Parabeggiatoa sp. HSG14]|uniref:heme ABC transporter permease n=1 Tax=Candidatus Parabeggiatoa sp. HSG14 TaxID=3055593 RepID=UPI0025A7EDFE|nr:heme ABC transporter permease [Thiotrichales bacterium HSG14]
MWLFFQKLASPKYFYNFSGRLIPWFGWACLALFAVGLYYSLIEAPPDYQQKESVRIMYIHVPSAWMSMFVYMVMAITGGIGLIWRMKIAEVIAASSAPIGASFTFLALATGSLWGKPMWGTWWVWDARLTSELILLFLYLGVIALNSAIEDKRIASRASAVLALVGVVNIPIIHYSVLWWNTLHQPPSIKASGISIHYSMLIALLLMAVAFKLFYMMVVLMRARCEILDRERNTSWVQELVSARSAL